MALELIRPDGQRESDEARHEQALEGARAVYEDMMAGKIIAFVGVGVAADKSTFQYRAAAEHLTRLEMYGAIAVLQHETLSELG